MRCCLGGYEVGEGTGRTACANSVTICSCMTKRDVSYDPKLAIARASSGAYSSPRSCNSTASSVEGVSFLQKTRVETSARVPDGGRRRSIPTRSPYIRNRGIQTIAGIEKTHDEHLLDDNPASCTLNTHGIEVLVPSLRVHLQPHSSTSTRLVGTSIEFGTSLDTYAAAQRVPITATCTKKYISGKWSLARDGECQW
jgi:hypothetical protein